MHTEIFKNTILPLKNTLFRIAWRITQNHSEAEDIVQDVFLKIWDLREEWKNISCIGAYCSTIVKNKALAKIQSKKNNLCKDLEVVANCYPADAFDPYRKVEHSNQYAIVKELLLELPERQQQIMMLREFEEKSYIEIALALDMTEGQVKICLFRIRQALKKKIEKINSYGL